MNSTREIKVRKAAEPVVMDFKVVPIGEVPQWRGGDTISKWLPFFKALPINQAARFEYNSRQRAQQVRATITTSMRRNYHKVTGVKTRIIRGEPAIHGTDKWLLYVWREAEPPTEGSDNDKGGQAGE